MQEDIVDFEAAIQVFTLFISKSRRMAALRLFAEEEFKNESDPKKKKRLLQRVFEGADGLPTFAF